MAHASQKVVAKSFILAALLINFTTDTCGAQSSTAKATLDSSGNLILSAEYNFQDDVPVEYTGSPWNKSDHSDQHFIYFDLRMGDYESNFASYITNLSSRFPSDGTLYTAGSNRVVLQHAYFMGLYDFDSQDFGVDTTISLPDFQFSSANTYYSAKSNSGLLGVANGMLDLRVQLPFDGSSNYNATDLLLLSASGDTLATDDITNSIEMGDRTGSWISTSSAADIDTYGLVTGDYEFFVYTEFHEIASTGILVIGAYQENIGFARFTIVDENTSVAPSATISKSTSYIGEADLTLGTGFTLNSGAHVEFVVSNGHGITFDGGFKAVLGASFSTELSGGTSLSKSGGNIFADADSPDTDFEQTSPADGFSVDVFPNPSARSASLLIVVPEPVNAEVEIFDILGRRVGTAITVRLGSGENRVRIADLTGGADLLSGQYFVRINMDLKVLHAGFTVTR